MADANNYFQEDGTSSKLETLQKQHKKKTEKIHELKNQIESLKSRLDETKNVVSKGSDESMKKLSENYNQLRDEYNLLLGQKSNKKQVN
ncbi:hypothetical protein HanXRQr2_Chr13g0586541 [Helianthus annuus]|uniref:Uncharacterized protein n=1 Tax=Helianthus annuus TaxID=4232 RepID=A0A9K3HBJ3_HELAN|nr:hypothetical protein HanXRQr2_Chr13g0586541 [Helianthus annuus]KAJ0481081.1 hypothetical protein HanIR_Chr13g0638731 [Helianthus annuus]KAJ0849067.1 hypothetical protein HanPSC8_Chr13g0564701 [Helianthus annuus]